jgi:hypothetical protein
MWRYTVNAIQTTTFRIYKVYTNKTDHECESQEPANPYRIFSLDVTYRLIDRSSNTSPTPHPPHGSCSSLQSKSGASSSYTCGQCCGSGSGRIRTFLVGSGSGRLGPDPDPDPGLNKWPLINFFGVCKSHRYFRITCCLTFWFMNILFKAYFGQKNFWRSLSEKLYR